MRVALYLRVSTDEQTVEPQRQELLEVCRRRGWTEVREYADKISGAKWTRLGLEGLMGDVRRGKVDAVVCVKLDRLGRSLQHLAQLIGELDAHRVALVCTSQGIDTSDGNPSGRLQMHVLMAVAEFERELIRERTKAGLRVAVANGKRLGRPEFELTPAKRALLADWAKEEPRAPYEVLARMLGCSTGKAYALGKKALGAATG